MSRVLLVASKYEFGQPELGLSYEYHNVYEPLMQVFDEVDLFDPFPARESTSRDLLAKVQANPPDWVLFMPVEEELDLAVIGALRAHTVTTAYLFDDMWRVDFARRWAQYMTFITTSDVNGVAKFRDAGYTNVVYSPFGYGRGRYTKLDLPKQYDVTFVGQYNPFRAWILGQLRKAGIAVEVWGHRWKPDRHVSHEEMVRIFNQSKINLNLSNSASWDLRYLLSSPRALRSTLRSQKTHEQVKGRHFEIGGCGGFQLSYYVEGLERHYAIGEEIAIFGDLNDLIWKARYFLKHEEEREAIAARAFQRSQTEHTMEARLRKLAYDTGVLAQ